MKIIYTASLLVLTIIGISCGVQSYVEKDPTVDIKNYKTFSWISERGDDNEDKPYKNFEESYLINTITRELEKNGWEKVKSNPDALIDYDIMYENELRRQSQPVYSQPFVRYFYNPYTRRISSIFYPSTYLGQASYAVPYKSGTITINIVDNKTKRLVWQGWAETEVVRRRIEKEDIDKIVRAIFKKLDVAQTK